MDKQVTVVVTIPTELAGKRLDQAIAELCSHYSRSQLKQWILAGFVQIDGTAITLPRHQVQPSQVVTIEAKLAEQVAWKAQAIALDCVFEDDSLMIINKPAGLVVHPGAGNPDSTLVNALLQHNPDLAMLPRCGLIHRLDKDTSGLLVIAKTLPSYHALVQALADRLIERHYQALVHGVMIAGGTIKADVGRHPRHRTHMSVVKQGKKATTHYRVLKRFKAHTLVDVKLETGRTHQIRVHLAHINYPLVGDQTYGKRGFIPAKLAAVCRDALKQFKRQALHAYKLGLSHPVTGQTLEFSSPLPQDMQQLIEHLNNDR